MNSSLEGKALRIEVNRIKSLVVLLNQRGIILIVGEALRVLGVIILM